VLKIVKNLWVVRAPPRTPTGELTALHRPVMWSEMWSQTGLVLGQDRSETKKSVFLLQVLCCVVKYNPVTIVVIIILEDTPAFQVLVQFLYFVLGTSLLWRSTVAFTYLKVKSAKCLCLLPVVLVLRIWSCLHHCQTP